MDRGNKGNDKAQKKGSNPRIVTMDSIRNSQQDSERQAYFAGGSEHSGQQILGRGKRKNDQDPSHTLDGGDALAAAFRRASASHAGDTNVVSLHQGPRTFAGIGHRLGDAENIGFNESTAPLAPMSIDNENPAQVILTLWENGYNIDDGPLQSYDDPKCADLMANVNRGELPTNILSSERVGPVHLAVVDNRGEKYKESVKVFGGKGHTLGSPTPNLTSSQVGTTSEVSVATSETSPVEVTSRNINQASSNNGNEQLKSVMDSLALSRSRQAKALNFDEDGAGEGNKESMIVGEGNNSDMKNLARTNIVDSCESFAANVSGLESPRSYSQSCFLNAGNQSECVNNNPTPSATINFEQLFQKLELAERNLSSGEEVVAAAGQKEVIDSSSEASDDLDKSCSKMASSMIDSDDVGPTPSLAASSCSSITKITDASSEIMDTNSDHTDNNEMSSSVASSNNRDDIDLNVSSSSSDMNSIAFRKNYEFENFDGAGCSNTNQVSVEMPSRESIDSDVSSLSDNEGLNEYFLHTFDDLEDSLILTSKRINKKKSYLSSDEDQNNSDVNNDDTDEDELSDDHESSLNNDTNDNRDLEHSRSCKDD